jgi:hypothetical protein
MAAFHGPSQTTWRSPPAIHSGASRPQTISEDHARQTAMLDDLLEEDMADAILYIDWLVERLADGAKPLPGVLRFTPHPRPWHAEWITLAS